MAISKNVKVGGSLFRGHALAVLSTPGDYNLVITNTSGAALNSISITPDDYGPGDTFSLRHMNDTGGTGQTIAILATNMHNAGANAVVSLDFPALQKISKNESLKFVYTNTATRAMNIYLITEWVGLTVTA